MAAINRESDQLFVSEILENEASVSLIDRMIERSHGDASPLPEQVEPVSGLVLARIVAFQGTLPQLLMDIAGDLRYSTAVAVTGNIDPAKDVGAEVCISFDRNDVRRPIVLGKIHAGLNESVSNNGNKVEISSDTEIVLRCGKASIHLRSDGTVAIRGTNVASRASETNRIRGGNVQIN